MRVVGKFHSPSKLHERERGNLERGSGICIKFFNQILICNDVIVQNQKKK